MNTMNTQTIATIHNIFDVMVEDYTEGKIINQRISIMIDGKKVSRPIARFLKILRADLLQDAAEGNMVEGGKTISLIRQVAEEASKTNYRHGCENEAEGLSKLLTKALALNAVANVKEVTKVAEVEQSTKGAEVAFIQTTKSSKAVTNKKAVPSEVQPEIKAPVVRTLADIRKKNLAKKPVEKLEDAKPKAVVPTITVEDGKVKIHAPKKAKGESSAMTTPVVKTLPKIKKIPTTKSLPTVTNTPKAPAKKPKAVLSEGAQTFLDTISGKNKDWAKLAKAKW